MNSKIFALAALFICFSIYHAESSTNDTNINRKEILELLSELNRVQMNSFKSKNIVEYTPLTLQMVKHMMMMKMYYEREPKNITEQGAFKQHDDFRQLLETLRSQSELNITSSLFYNSGSSEETPPPPYVQKVEQYFKTETISADFSPTEQEQLIEKINNWLTKNTKGHWNAISISLDSNQDSYELSTLNFEACWLTQKKILKRRSSRTRKPFNFKMISATESVPYIKNDASNYTAISIPLKTSNHREFKMAVLRPHRSFYFAHMIDKFSSRDYEQLFDELSKAENSKIVEYQVPYLNSNTFIINERGVGINHDDLSHCESPIANPDTQAQSKFIVESEFAVFVYHEPSKSVLLSALVNAPPESTYEFLNNNPPPPNQ